MTKVVYMYSLARAGETMMLNILNNHPDCEILYQLKDKDSKKAKNLADDLQKNPVDELPKNYYTNKKFLIVKNGVVNMKHPEGRGFKHSFALIRDFNEILYSFVKLGWCDSNMSNWTKEAVDKIDRWYFHNKKSGDKAKNTTDKLLCYVDNRFNKILTIYSKKVPVYVYEDVVKYPDYYLDKLQEDLDFDTIVPSSKLLNVPKEIVSNGHGYNDLSRKIDTNSLDTWKNDDTFCQWCKQNIDIKAEDMK